MTFLRRVPNVDMPIIYSTTDLTFLPMDAYATFTFGMVLLESMSCGTAVVSAPIPAAKDIIENWINGVIVPFDCSLAMANAWKL